MIVSHLLLILHKKIQFYIFMFEAWNVAKGRKVQGGRILSQGTVPVTRTIQRRSDQLESTLQDCFDHADWEMFREASENYIDLYADSVSEFLLGSALEMLYPLWLLKPTLTRNRG